MRKEHCYKGILLAPFLTTMFSSCTELQSREEKPQTIAIATANREREPVKKVLDTVAYNQMLSALANNDSTGKWPARAPYPLPGAVLPYHRIVAFYGNLYSKKMGILGELPKNEMLKKLKG